MLRKAEFLQALSASCSNSVQKKEFSRKLHCQGFRQNRCPLSSPNFVGASFLSFFENQVNKIFVAPEESNVTNFNFLEEVDREVLAIQFCPRIEPLMRSV